MDTSNTQKTCLNCKSELHGIYCTECSQASSTGRMSFSRLFAEDFLASIFTMNRGFFRTCVDLIVRPGELVTKYLAGHRKSYFHFAALLLILLAIDALLLSMAINSEVTLATSGSESSDILNAKGVERMHDFFKFALAFITPLLALIPYFLFKKLSYFFAEHIVIAWFYLAMNFLISIPSRLIGLLPISSELYWNSMLVFYLPIFALTLRFYWQISAPAEYANWSRALRVTIAGLTSTSIFALSTAILMIVFSI